MADTFGDNANIVIWDASREALVSISSMGILHLFREVRHRIRRSFELRKYTPYTIAAYLRKTGAQVGEGCFIVPTEIGTEPYLVKIGNRVAIAAGVRFITHDGAVWAFRDAYPDLQVFGPIVIEDNCIIGQQAILFPNIRIGRNSIVGAGSVVIADVPPNSLVMGIPARPFGSVEKYRQKSVERWLEQRPPDAVIEEGATWWNSRNFEVNREKLRRHLLEIFRDRLA